MRRLRWLLPMLALAVAGCQDTHQPVADFQVSDGSAFGGYGNPHFYILPPLVPSPDYSGTFDPNLLPYLSIQVSGPFDDDTQAVCENPRYVFTEADGLEVDPVGERYSYGWNTPKSLRTGKVYRICMVLEVPGVDPYVLGFRDVSPQQGGGSVAEDPVYRFNNGSNLAIKFRVELGALVGPLCTSGTLGDDYDCTAQVLNSNETALCDNATCLLTTGVMDAPELWLIEKFGIDNPQCFESDGTSTIAGFPLTMDIPQYAGCVRVTLFDEDLSFDGFVDSYGTVGACFYPQSGPPVKVAQGQDEAIQMHIQYPGAGPVIWALPWGATGGIFSECELAEQQVNTSTVGGQVAAALRRVWRGTQEALNPWFAPPQVWAFHTGFGGHTSFSPDEEGLSPGGGLLRMDLSADEPAIVPLNMSTSQVFTLAWALPSQMAASTFCAGTGCSGVATQPLTINLGETVTLTIRVTDNGAVADASAFGGRALGTPRAVEGATVSFSDAQGGSNTVTTGTNGFATYSFTPTTKGATSITASGFGIGTTAGPYDAFVNGQYVNQASLLGLGTLSFDIRVCEPGPNVNGLVQMDDGYPTSAAGWQAVPVNLGGNTSGTAYMYLTNDCDYLYATFLMPSDDSKDNKLRFVFAQDGDASDGIAESALDDILSLSAAGFRDRYLSPACVGSKQADCGPDDPDRPADGMGVAQFQVFAAPFLGKSSWYVYEMKHPLRAMGSPYDLDLVPGKTVYFYGAVSLGTGTKGNTEFPDQKGNFKNYGYSYTVQ